MQVYRGMDIGTATPTAQERGGVPHHLLDVWEPAHGVSVAEFQAEARAAIDAILGRGGVPIVVGGSGLYVAAVLDDLRFPGTDPAVRARLEAELAEAGPAAMHARLAAVDPAAASAILPTNGRRVVRALEVVEITGRAVHRPPAGAGRGLSQPSGSASTSPGTRWTPGSPNAWTGCGSRASSTRCAGSAARACRRTPTAARALGYQQVLAFLAGDCTEEQARQDTIDATRRFARRQQRWFRRDGRGPVGRLRQPVGR